LQFTTIDPDDVGEAVVMFLCVVKVWWVRRVRRVRRVRKVSNKRGKRGRNCY
jgi:hypothetical protein